MPWSFWLEKTFENCIHSADTWVSDPGALPASRATEMEENARPMEAYSLGVALRNASVHPFLVDLNMF